MVPLNTLETPKQNPLPVRSRLPGSGMVRFKNSSLRSVSTSQLTYY